MKTFALRKGALSIKLIIALVLLIVLGLLLASKLQQPEEIPCVLNNK